MFCSLFSDCQKVFESPVGAVRWFFPSCVQRNKAAGFSFSWRGSREGVRTCYWVLIPAGFLSSRAWSLCGSEDTSQHAACSWSDATPYVWHWGLKSHRKDIKGRQGWFFLVVVITNWGCSTRLCWVASVLPDRCSMAGCTWAVSRSPPRSSPAVSWCIWPSGLLFMLPFPPISFPISLGEQWSKWGGRWQVWLLYGSTQQVWWEMCMYESVGCSVQRCHLRSSGVLPLASLLVSI